MSDEAAGVPPGRVLLIDLENCPNQINHLMKSLEQYSQVVICYAQSGARVPIDWIVDLTAVVNANRLRIVKTPGNGKNAADFGITFWAGVLMAQLPEDTGFVIVSEDTDLDHAVGLLKSQGRMAERVGTKKEAKPVAASAMEPDQRLKEYCGLLLAHPKTRPGKGETLLNSLNAHFGKQPDVQAEALFEALRRRGVVTVEEGKLVYHEDKLNALAGI